ncbi:MAG TPA: RDD family protein, partial [Puia sp.]|nr:RDD family protein [Puia sp.]
TMGHLIFKLKVVSLAGRKATFSQVFVRRICDVLEISWCFGLVAYLIARNTPNHQRLGDLVAKTMVVDYAFMPDDVTFDFEEPLHENAERRKTINPYL